jgi:YidC/Oxa1 family membrane protein insertase
MEKRTLMAFVLSFVVLVGWSYLFSPDREQPATPPAPSENVEEAVPDRDRSAPPQIQQPAAQPQVKTEEKPAAPNAQRKLVEVDTPLYNAVISTEGPTFTSFQLKKYRRTSDPGSPLIELISLSPDQALPVEIAYVPEGSKAPGPSIFEVDQDALVLDGSESPKQLVFRSRSSEGIESIYTFRFFPDSYSIKLDIETRNLTEKVLTGSFITRLRYLPPDSDRSYYSFRGLVVLVNEKLEELKIKKVQEEEKIEGTVNWLAYENEYFLSAVVPGTQSNSLFRGTKLLSGILEGVHTPEPVLIQPGGVASSGYSLFFGPRDMGVLKNEGNKLAKAVNFGWTDIIAKPLLYVLRFFENFLHNYGLAIIVLTILVKILFWPLTHKSYKSMGEMKKLQPRLMKLKEKYKNDRQAMNREMMTLYRTYKINPMSGCLPMIIQLPVFFALFRVLGSAIELRHAPFFLWIDDLSAPDRLFSFPFSVPLMSPPYGIPVLTLLMGASMFLQQKMTPAPGDPAQAKMMMFLPLIFTFFFINFPSGLVLYWLVNNLISIGQQYHIIKRSK